MSFSQMPISIQSTPDNSNPRKLEPKSISPGIPSYIYYNFTPDNSNLPLTRSNFLFPFRPFLYKYNSNHTLSAWQVEKKCTAVRNIEIILTTMYSLS